MRNLSRTALLVLIIGVTLLLIAPFIVTRPGCISFKETGTIGDTIGGITAPITGLIGAVLVFLALRAQIVANEIIQGQIKDQKSDDKRKKELNYISDLYKYFLKSVEDFDYGNHSGNAAILAVLKDMANWKRDYAHDENIIKQGKPAEYLSLLTFAKLLVEKVNNSNVDNEDKNLFKELIKHHIESIVIPGFSIGGHKDPCLICGQDHNGIPFKFHQIVEEVNAHF